MSLAGNIGYILMGFIAIVLVFLVILGLLEKKLHIRFLRGRYARNDFFIEKIANMKVHNINDSLRELSNLATLFFREAFHIKGNLDYSELTYYFNNKNNKKATQFCAEIVKYMYSKEKITQEKFHELVRLLAEIVSSNKIITKEQKKELDKKSQKNNPLIKSNGLMKIIKKIKK